MKVHFDPDHPEHPDPSRRTEVYKLPALDSWPETWHRFDARSVWAVRAALAARRPLLVRGEPGLGKSQLARAAAHILNVPFLCQVINARCECTDLLYTYDAVSRLAQAQVMGSASQGADWADKLTESRFVQPGILWWTFDWESARQQAGRFCRIVREPFRPNGWTPGQGCVVLIDEIDKADADTCLTACSKAWATTDSRRNKPAVAWLCLRTRRRRWLSSRPTRNVNCRRRSSAAVLCCR